MLLSIIYVLGHLVQEKEASGMHHRVSTFSSVGNAVRDRLYCSRRKSDQYVFPTLPQFYVVGENLCSAASGKLHLDAVVRRKVRTLLLTMDDGGLLLKS